MRYSFKATFAILIVLLVLLCITLGAHLYKSRFHPLARLAQTIVNTDDISKVRKLMKAYKANHDNQKLLYTDKYPDKTCGPKNRDDILGCLSIHDQSILGDVGLLVYFNEDSKVTDILYVAD